MNDKNPEIENQFLLTVQPTLFTTAQSNILGSRGITTIKQFLALYHTPIGPEGLGTLLQLDKEALERLVQHSAALVGKEEEERLSTPAPKPAMGLVFEKAPLPQTANPEERETEQQTANNNKGEEE